MIPFNFINKNVKIHNGAWFAAVEINKHKLKHKFGEFSFTKKYDTQLQIRKKTKKKSKK